MHTYEVPSDVHALMLMSEPTMEEIMRVRGGALLEMAEVARSVRNRSRPRLRFSRDRTRSQVELPGCARLALLPSRRDAVDL